MRGPSRRVFQDKGSEPIGDKEATRFLRMLYRASKGIDNLGTQEHTATT